jgi:hypothetical protein
MYYVNIGPMSVTVNVVIRVLCGLAAYLITLWCCPGVSSECVLAVIVCVVFINLVGNGGGGGAGVGGTMGLVGGGVV